MAQQLRLLAAGALFFLAGALWIADDRGNAEGLPITFLEAQASGLPLIVSTSGGTGEGVVHGEMSADSVLLAEVYSARLDADSFLISPFGVDRSSIDESDFVLVRGGRVHRGGRQVACPYRPRFL